VIPTLRLGELETSALGYGAMVLIGFYGTVDEQQGMAVISRAHDFGVTRIDTSDAYGVDGTNERLVQLALDRAPKSGSARRPARAPGARPHGSHSKTEGIKSALEELAQIP
jgi:aryl-alcohol dehydrogenase-like predicted oxidoreductase